MGHFPLSNKRAPAIPRDLKLGIYMRKKPEPGEPPGVPAVCIPTWTPWTTVLDPETVSEASLAAEWTLTVLPGEGTNTCGKCLEWLLGEPLALDGVSGAPPVMTIEPHPTDCRAVVVRVDGQSPPPLNYMIVVHAELDGLPFGRDGSYVINLPTPVDHAWSGGEIPGAGGNPGDAIVHYPGAGFGIWSVAITLSNVFDPLLLTWNDVITNDGLGSLVNVQNLGDFFGPNTQTIQFDGDSDDVIQTPPQDDNWKFEANPVYDGVPYPFTLVLEKTP